MKKTVRFILLLGVLGGVVCPASAQADSVGYIARGVTKTVASVFAIPVEMLRDSGRVMFPFGLVTGAVKGSVKTVGGVLSGAVDIARGAAPYAKYLVFL